MPNGYTREPGDDTDEEEANANANGARPYLDVPPPGTRPAKQPFWQDGNRFVTAEEIKAFVGKQYPETVKLKRKLVRPDGWIK